MKKEKLETVLKDAWEAGSTDTYVEDQLVESAVRYIEEDVKGKITDDQEDEIIEAYRMGFMGQQMGELKPEVIIAKLKEQLKKARADAKYYKELYEYNNIEM